MVKIKVAFKFWFETKEKYVFGEGALKLLEEVSKSGSLLKAANSVQMSYRYAWGLLNKIKKAINSPVIITHRGGKHGGGGSRLTDKGKFLLQSYLKIKKDFNILSKKHSEYLQSHI